MIYIYTLRTSLELLAHALHELANLRIDLEIFEHASVDAEPLLLGEIVVRVGLNAFLVARVDKAVEHVGDGIDLGLSSLDFQFIDGSSGSVLLASESEK